ncbi:MAG: hypothetical protein OQK32_05160 [Gammaproteobacteria bacterium]|nr:hypothetical protein [Gammaproteobacteria bacterium]
MQHTGLLKSCSLTSSFVRLNTIIIIASALPALFNRAAAADEGIVKLTAGAEYISGDYGDTESVDQLYVPLTTRYTTSRSTLRLTIPYIRLTAPADAVQTGNIIPPGTNKMRTDSGIGDVIAGVTFHDTLNTEASSDLAIDFTAKVKLGTADEDKGLGTGENDYTMQAELYNYHDRFMLFGILGYKFRGDPPGINLNNSWLAFVGGNYRLTRSLKVGLDFYYQEALIPDIDNQMELSAFLGYKISSTTFLRGYLLKGITNASPDWGAGAFITFMQ